MLTTKRFLAQGLSRRALLLFLVLATAAIPRPLPAAVKVLFVPVKGHLTQDVVSNKLDGIEEALAGKLEHLILKLSLTGADLDALFRLGEYVYGIREKGVRTYGLIMEREEPGYATLLAAACQKIAMEENTRLGGLAAFGLDQGKKERLLAWVKEFARPPVLFRRMAEGNEELSAYLSSATQNWAFLTKKQFDALDEDERRQYVKSERICAENERLLLSSAAASSYRVTQYVVADQNDLLNRLSGAQAYTEDEIRELGTSGFPGKGDDVWTSIANALQLSYIRFLLIAGGLLCIFIEFQVPGFGVPGILGLTCFTLFFGSAYATNYASIIEVALFVVGIGLVALELFVFPGFGAAGIAGLTAILVSLVLAMIKDDQTFDWDEFGNGLLTTFLAVACGSIGIMVSLKYLPKSRMVRRAGLVHEADISGTSLEAGPAPQDAASETWPLGEEGVAVTSLRPAGKARVGGRLLDVVSVGEVIEAGEPIVVLAKAGPRTVVGRRPPTKG